MHRLTRRWGGIVLQDLNFPCGSLLFTRPNAFSAAHYDSLIMTERKWKHKQRYKNFYFTLIEDFFFLSLWFFQNEQNRLQSLIQVWTILILEIAANIYLLCNNIAVYWCSVNCAQQQAHIWTKMQVRLFQAKFLLFLCRVLYLLQLDIFKKRAQIFQFFFPWKILSGNSNFDYQTLGKRQESGERK